MDSVNKVTNLHELKLVILPGMGAPANARQYYEVSYESWKKVWKQTLLELDGSDRLFSDHFTRQDFHLTVFHGLRCVAAVSFRRIDLQSQADLEDSWLRLWPIEIIKGEPANLKFGLMTSWFYVDPDYRRTDADDHLAGLMVSHRVTEMISYLVLDLEADITLGGVRKNRSVTKLIEPTGCKVLKSNVINHGVEVDLVAWLPDSAREAIEKYSPASRKLWEERLVFDCEPLQASKPNVKIKSA